MPTVDLTAKCLNYIQKQSFAFSTIGHSQNFIAEVSKQLRRRLSKYFEEKSIVESIILILHECVIFVIPGNLLKDLIIHHLLLI
jgi:hypothetical protein